MCELVEEYAEKKAKRYAEEREMQVIRLSPRFSRSAQWQLSRTKQ